MAYPPLVISHSSGTASTTEQGLFAGLNFFLVRRLPARSSLISDIEANGGRVVRLEQAADYVIADHMRPDAPGGSYSYTFIEAAVRDGQLPQPADHATGRTAGLPRDVGSSAPTKSTRTAFTDEDDRTLWKWVQDQLALGGAMKGNDIYKALGANNSRHTWQAWRDRYIKRLMHNSPEGAGLTSATDALPATSQTIPSLGRPAIDAEQSQQRPSKRQRLDDSTTDLPMSTSSGDQQLHPTFEKSDFDFMMSHAQDIEEIPKGNILAAWDAFAQAHCEHTADEWRLYYEERVRPVFLKKSRSDRHSREEMPAQVVKQKGEVRHANAVGSGPDAQPGHQLKELLPRTPVPPRNGDSIDWNTSTTHSTDQSARVPQYGHVHNSVESDVVVPLGTTLATLTTPAIAKRKPVRSSEPASGRLPVSVTNPTSEIDSLFIVTNQQNPILSIPQLDLTNRDLIHVAKDVFGRVQGQLSVEEEGSKSRPPQYWPKAAMDPEPIEVNPGANNAAEKQLRSERNRMAHHRTIVEDVVTSEANSAADRQLQDEHTAETNKRALNPKPRKQPGPRPSPSPNVSQAGSASQPSIGESPSSSPQWTIEEDDSVLRGIRLRWDSHHIAGQLPGGVKRTSNAVRAQKAFLRSKLRSTYSDTSSTKEPLADNATHQSVKLLEGGGDATVDGWANLEDGATVLAAPANALTEANLASQQASHKASRRTVVLNNEGHEPFEDVPNSPNFSEQHRGKQKVHGSHREVDVVYPKLPKRVDEAQRSAPAYGNSSLSPQSSRPQSSGKIFDSRNLPEQFDMDVDDSADNRNKNNNDDDHEEDDNDDGDRSMHDGAVLSDDEVNEAIQEVEYSAFGDAVDLNIPEPDGGFRYRSSAELDLQIDFPSLEEPMPKKSNELTLKNEMGEEVVELSSGNLSSSPYPNSELESHRVEIYKHVREHAVETQDIFNAETQLPDLSVPLPIYSDGGDNDDDDDDDDDGNDEDDEDENDDENMAGTSPDPMGETVSDTRHLSRAFEPVAQTAKHEDDNVGDDDAVNSWIATMEVRGYKEQSAVQALKHTSMNAELAELVLLEEKLGYGLPVQIPGIWSTEDDENLESGNGVAIEQLEKKHGWPACQARMIFLEEYRELA